MRVKRLQTKDDSTHNHWSRLFIENRDIYEGSHDLGLGSLTTCTTPSTTIVSLRRIVTVHRYTPPLSIRQKRCLDCYPLVCDTVVWTTLKTVYMIMVKYGHEICKIKIGNEMIVFHKLSTTELGDEDLCWHGTHGSSKVSLSQDGSGLHSKRPKLGNTRESIWCMKIL